ncbi:MAG: transglycosylase SLT domain-containing protein, partial [Acidobacteriaceae bacterium]|nr:transglycosylase SLT domain-containing protein [Acidobacteriaceae bacterium]
MSKNSEQITLVHWSDLQARCRLHLDCRFFRLSIALAVVALASFSAVSRNTVKKASPGIPAPKIVGAAGLIAVARHQLDLCKFSAAAEYAVAASGKAPMLDDYAQYIRAQAEYQLHNYPEVAKSTTRVFDQKPLSPFVGAAAALAVRADLDSESPKQALELIQKYFDRIPQPEADLLLARSFEATGDLPEAADYYQHVYYEYPTAHEATDAANALVNVKTRLGDSYPLPTSAAMLVRAAKLFEAKEPGAARIELAAAIPEIAGAQRDLARVRLGEADFFNKNTAAAFQYLSALKVDDPEADAERLCFLVRCTRNIDRHGDVKSFLDSLEKQHPNSTWRLQTLIDVADQARLDHDAATYLPLYRACEVTFPNDSRAGWCHWRIAYESYRQDQQDAYDLLREQIQRYPNSIDTNDALYFLGRLEERKSDNAAARACYDELVTRFPNTYYAVLARDRLKDPSIMAATPAPPVVEFLKSISWPALEQFPSFEPGDTVRSRIQRAQLLQLTGLNDFAEGELKFGAHNDAEQENLYAYELAKMATTRNSPNQALHYIKTYAPGYLYMPLDQAPVGFWRLAFPLPHRASIDQYSRLQGIDPFLVAALIRQESEFDPAVISYANAYGLMQVLPSTGRQLARHFGVRRLNA